jgi:heptosyltransferase-2
VSEVQRLYVRAPNWVGDLVMATAAFERLRAGFPAARITVAVRPYLREMTTGAGWHDEVLEAPKVRSVAELRARVRELRERRFDLAVVLPNSFETALIPFLAGIPRRVGWRQGRALLLTDGPRALRGRRWFRRHGPRRIPDPMPVYYEKLLDHLGIPPGPVRPRLALGADDRAGIGGWLRERGLDDGRKIVLITAGASYGASKLWIPERFAAVARHFAERGDTVPILLSGPKEFDLVQKIAEGAGGVPAAIAPALPLGWLKALCERASLMITTDTGPRHIALAFGVPVVCLMGPNDPRYTNYALDEQIVIQKRELECVPCQLKTCPLGHHECMKRITIDEVVEAAERMLARGRFPH